MCVSSPKAPTPPPALPEAPTTPDTTTGETTGDRDKRRRRASTSTILTSTRGVQNGAATAQKTLLGS